MLAWLKANRALATAVGAPLALLAALGSAAWLVAATLLVLVGLPVLALWAVAVRLLWDQAGWDLVDAERITVAGRDHRRPDG